MRFSKFSDKARRVLLFYFGNTRLVASVHPTLCRREREKEAQHRFHSQFAQFGEEADDVWSLQNDAQKGRADRPTIEFRF